MAPEVPSASLIAGTAFTALALRILYRWWAGSNASGLPYPPGPKGYPLINNVLDVPLERPWEGYEKLSRQYGDIMFFKIFGRPMLILSSERRVKDLFEKQATIYSGKPYSVMLNDLLQFKHFFAILDYGASWRKHRKAFHQHFDSNVLPKYHLKLKKYTERFLVALSEGEDLSEASRNAIAGLGIAILYGVDVKSVHDPFISDALLIGDAFKAAGVPGKFLVETLPFLRYVPSWVPGAGFQRWASYYREASLRLLNNPFQFVWNRHKAAEAKECIATALIDQFPENDPDQLHEDSIVARNVCAMTHLAAVDTTHASSQGFFFAMLLYPEVQKAAQEELDRVVGPGVIPDINQSSELPYINAIVKELLRWLTVMPLALPHLVKEDHVYDGYFIPKGTTVFGNAWAMMHDPEVYEDPMVFKPERYLKDGKLKLDAPEPLAGFGFGRRICPGRYLAIEILFSLVSSTLTLYNILPPKDDLGNPVVSEPRFAGGAMMKPEPFNALFEPRSVQALATLEDMKSHIT
ncbi:cytochrome P450 [Ephemerocybe angulata]|uniref:Cytochrome P450 n=1 Tax=Ephemerocybe angulata TaxID=980116 RepID=A0A8H6HD92_9AGAR|nr:cytochrome P450 [Tulosesus angulatus]